MYDLVIIGAGPSGLTASIYASCYQLSHVVIGKTIGGQLNLAPDVLNFPGFNAVRGVDLVARMVAQTKQYGALIMEDEAVRIDRQDASFRVRTICSKEYEAKTLILATGTERRKLNVPGELEYTGRGVYYTVVVEPAVFQGKDVVIVGGGNAGFQAASVIADSVKSLTILEATATLRAEGVWVDKLKAYKNIAVLLGCKTTAIQGNGTSVESIEVMVGGFPRKIAATCVFVEIGGVPGSALVAPLGIKLDERGFIAVSESMATSVEGIFAAGDIVGSKLSLEQLSTAVGLGARASASAYFYLKSERAPVVWGKAQIRRK